MSRFPFWPEVLGIFSVGLVVTLSLALGKYIGYQDAVAELSGNYHTLVPLTEVYDNGCIYNETYAVEMPEGVACPEHIAILY